MRFWIFAMLCICSPSFLLHAEDRHTVLALKHTFASENASAVLLDWQTGNILDTWGDSPTGAPGSVIKPLLLDYALEHNVVSADMRVYCRRSLRIAGRSLSCTHPAAQPVFTAESALAQSCNTWFAEMGRRFTGTQLDRALDTARVPHVSMSTTDDDHRELAALGLYGSSVTPLELARSYRGMLLHLPADSIVVKGMAESAQYGMASPAHIEGLNLLGKTGTASNPNEAWTHGWFAGAVPGQFILVIYVPHSDGGVAAKLARNFLLEWARH